MPKHQRRIVGLDEKILALYARGNSTRDISAQLEELYGGAKISATVISEVIDSVSADVKAWQSRPLDEVYPIVYLDSLYVNINVSGRVSKRAVYVVLGIDREGDKQLLGLWIGEAETEGAKFWLKVLMDLKKEACAMFSSPAVMTLKAFLKRLKRSIRIHRFSCASCILCVTV